MNKSEDHERHKRNRSSPLDDVHTAPYEEFAARILEGEVYGDAAIGNPLSAMLKKEKEQGELWTPDRLLEQVNWQMALYQSAGMKVPSEEDIESYLDGQLYNGYYLVRAMNRIVAAGFEPQLITTPYCRAIDPMIDMWQRLMHRSDLKTISLQDGDYGDDVSLRMLFRIEQEQCHIEGSTLTSELPGLTDTTARVHWEMVVTTKEALTNHERLEVAEEVGYEAEHISEIILSEYLASNFLGAREGSEPEAYKPEQQIGFNYYYDRSFPMGLTLTARGNVLTPITFQTARSNNSKYVRKSAWSR